jgi:hypothetical protein
MLRQCACQVGNRGLGVSRGSSGQLGCGVQHIDPNSLDWDMASLGPNARPNVKVPGSSEQKGYAALAENGIPIRHSLVTSISDRKVRSKDGGV